MGCQHGIEGTCTRCADAEKIERLTAERDAAIARASQEQKWRIQTAGQVSAAIARAEAADAALERVSKAIADPLLTGINIGNGSLDIGMKGAGPTLLAGMFLGMLDDNPQAVNYVEVTFDSPKGPIVVTVARPGGKTPHQLRQEAEARTEASLRDSARVLAMYRALRERMQAAMQETIEEQPR